MDYEALMANSAVRAWVENEHHRAVSLLDATYRRLKSFEKQPGLPALWVFARSIRDFSRRRLPRLFPFLRQPAAN
jgi:hypothetical protein